MKRQDLVEMGGVVTESLPNAMSRVCLENGCLVLTHVPGRIRRNCIRILTGDGVKIALSPYDLTKGRIIYRLRTKPSNGDKT
uniref:Translation initiation factor IF-1 n=1 Tax=Selaginella kraussiana TaxID=81964 RepID=A0A3Q9R2Q5_9TRAC|nr:translational initiation factor 1 [Selaginella kraussiana]AZU95808.1 translational initiation factor 1 [Selaginella kraussiana]